MQSTRSIATSASHYSRRDSLRLGALTAFGLGLGDLLRLRSAAADEQGTLHRSTAKSCILIWLDGGPSHLETFDPKPDAPSEIRGPLVSISTKIAGVRLSECLPLTAGMIDKVAIIRSMTSPLGEHNFGTHYLLTGYQPSPALEYPAIASVLAHTQSVARNLLTNVLPPNIAVPDFRVGGGGLTGNGYLPSATRPFAVGGDPASATFKVSDLDCYHGLDLSRIDRRRQFVQTLDEFSRGLEHSSADSGESDLQRAFDLIANPHAKRAFDLEDEPAEVRRRYGTKTIGQSCLLARRLVERGVPFVTVNNRGWDTHNDLQTRLKDGYTGAKVGVGLIPSLDLALSALVHDLQDRRMLDETLIVVMGEFGRTPKLNTSAGRDHWPRVFSTLLAGGGVAGGQVIGSSDGVGESPKDRPITPSDLAATIYKLLGIAADAQLHTSDGRPVRIAPPQAEVIGELIS